MNGSDRLTKQSYFSSIGGNHAAMSRTCKLGKKRSGSSCCKVRGQPVEPLYSWFEMLNKKKNVHILCVIYLECWPSV